MRTRLVHGFTLIEVLVAVLVLAIGIVGAAGVQLAALRTRHLTGLMSGAVQLAGALAERMRANTIEAQAADGANPYLQLDYDTAAGAPVPATSCFGATGCSSAELAAFDLYEIKQALYADFPGARVAVCRDAAVWSGTARALAWQCAGAPGAPIVIKIGWRDRRAQPDAGIVPSVALVVAGTAP